jgi:putative DNA primase/helicase
MTLVFDYNGIIRACQCNHRGEGHCPAHRDENPSFKVTRKDNGKVMVHCLAGCTQEQVITALKALGLVRNEKGPRPMTRPPTTYGEGSEDYHKLRQAYAALRVAMGCVGDARKWRKPDAQKALAPYCNGRHIDRVPVNALFLSAKQSSNLGGKHYPCMLLPVVNSATHRLQAVLLTYLTPDATRNLRGKENKSIRRFIGPAKGGYVILGRIKKDRPLIVGEGVESTLSAAQITGLPAISALSAGNMKAIALPPSSEVIIAPDNDNAGNEAAEALTQRLVSSGRVVRVVPPRRPPGRDKYDWNEALKDGQTDGTKFAELRQDILSSEVEKLDRPKSGYAISSVEFMDIVFPPREFIIEPWLETASLAMVYAKRGVGKTRFMMSVAYAIARGQSFLDWNIAQPRRVLYVDGELPGTLLQQR